MDDEKWRPTNEPDGYDLKRVTGLQPIQEAIDQLWLPPIRYRKLNGISNALGMQIEDGGDSPEVNDKLLEALKLAVIHQVGEEQAIPVLQTIDEFARTENQRWERIRTETQQLSAAKPDEVLDDNTASGSISTRQRGKQTHQKRDKKKKRRRK